MQLGYRFVLHYWKINWQWIDLPKPPLFFCRVNCFRVPKVIERAGLTAADIDLYELNEAFAPQVLAVLKGWGWDDRDKLNVNGSGISLGHPIGATGGRILANLMHELKRRDARYGLETMCIGGGQGLAAIFESVS